MIKNEDYEIYKEELLKKFSNILQLQKPIYLYKYLPLEGAVSSLEYKNIQFSSPFTFNDITEGRNSRFIFMGKELRKVLLSTSLNKYEINKSIDSRNIDNMTDEKIETIFSNQFEKITFGNTGVACFTTIENSEFHWQNYANMHKGICIRYNFENLLKFWNAQTNLFTYQGIKSLITNYIIYLNSINPIIFKDENKFLCAINWLNVKHKSYEPESEFRIYSNNCNISKGYDRIRISKNSIDKIYIGKNVQSVDKNKIEKLGFLIHKTDN